jgi:uroporphyrinogen decarboxylase
MSIPNNHLLLDALHGKPVPRPPVWFLRQAGRYQPAYRALRQQCPDFMTFCQQAELTTQAALIPIDDFHLDAAILFSDILTVPAALGMELHFVPEQGPVFPHPIRTSSDLEALTPQRALAALSYVEHAVRSLKSALQNRVPLIGFCGSPWTLATYMIEGKSSKTFQQAKSCLFATPELLHRLLDLLTDISIAYLDMQIAAGADAVMIFDSWGGILSREDYQRFSLHYMEKIVSTIKTRYQNQVPVTVFTKGGNAWLDIISQIDPHAISIDWTLPIDVARTMVPNHIAIQGNLDPSVLFADHDTIKQRALAMLTAHSNQPGYIANLGHGILPTTDPHKVATLASTILHFKNP